MKRYIVSFWASYVFLGYVKVWAENEAQAIASARNQRRHRGWRDAAKYDVTIEKR